MTRVRRITISLFVVVAALFVVAGTAGAQNVSPGERRAVGRADNAIPGQYLVMLNPTDPNAVASTADALAARVHGGEVIDVYTHAVQGFAVRMSDEHAQDLANDPAVASVQEDSVVSIDTTQTPTPSWGLDRVDQTNLPLNNQYTYAGNGNGVHAYVIDTGILTSHADFGGRATSGFDAIGGAPCNPATQTKSGHGTHVAGTIGGTTYGLAKNVSLVSVRVLGCGGSGPMSGVIDGVDWVTEHAIKPAVANMSLGVGASGSDVPMFETAIEGSIASGITYVVAAGNSNADACNSSPADVDVAITVGATTTTDSRDTSYSNFGTCVDLFAPGTSIVSDWNDGTTNTISGTSMATPHVAGAVARYLATNPCATPATAANAILGNASVGKVTSAGTGSPNLLLNTSFLGANAGPVQPCAPPNLTVTAGYDEAQLTWTIPSDGGSPITGYNIYRSTTSGGEGAVPFTTVSGVSTTSFTDDTAAGGTTYYYQVAAVNAGGEARSTEKSVTPLVPDLPGAPDVTAKAGDANVKLTWPLPDDGGSPLTGFVVNRGTTSGALSPLPGMPLAASATSYTDSTVTNGTTYYYTVTAQNAVNSNTSTEDSAIPLTSNGAYFPLTPARIMDTRANNPAGFNTPFTGGVTRDLQVTGRGGVPASVSAVVMNVTVTDVTTAGHVTVWPTGSSLPNASNVNVGAGQTRPNLVTVGVGTGGKVSFQLNAGSANVIADVVGYYGNGTGVDSGARYAPQSPYRILDSRDPTSQYTTPWPADSTRDLTLTGVPNDATAVVLNVTATSPTAAANATLWPSGLSRPNASNLNYVPGQTVPNLVIVGIGTNRKVSLYNNAGSVHFIADVVGWYGGSQANMVFTPASSPKRILDSRDGTGGFSTPWPADTPRDLTVAGTSPVPAGATAGVMNVTVTGPSAIGFLTVYPSGTTRPLVSNLNFVPGDTVPNLVMVKIGTNQKVSFYNNAGNTHVIADVVGWFTSEG